MPVALALSSAPAQPPPCGTDYAIEFVLRPERANPCRYWPCDLLSAFLLEMAARGCCVNESVMLGSRDYAIEQLRLVPTRGDEALR